MTCEELWRLLPTNSGRLAQDMTTSELLAMKKHAGSCQKCRVKLEERRINNLRNKPPEYVADRMLGAALISERLKMAIAQDAEMTAAAEEKKA